MRKGRRYPDDWPEIARAVKDNAGWVCERCRQPHDRASGHTLTVHHLDGDPANCLLWNLAALCQRCHLSVQNRVDFSQFYMLQHSPWMQPHVEGFQSWIDSKEEAGTCAP